MASHSPADQSRFWLTRLVQAGIYPDTPSNLAARLRLTNRVALTLGLVVLPLVVAIPRPFTKGLFASVAVLCMGIVWLNHNRQHVAGRFIASVIVPLLLLVLGTMFYEADPTEAAQFRMLMFGLAALPLALFQEQDRVPRWLGVGIAVFCFMGYGWMDSQVNLFHRTVEPLDDVSAAIQNYVAPALVLLFLLWTYSLTQAADRQLADRILAAERDSNEQLRRKERELQAAVTAAETAAAETAAREAELARQRAELEQQTKELEDARDNTRRLVKRLRLNQAELEGRQAELEAKQWVETGLKHLAEQARWQAGTSLAAWSDQVLRALMEYAGTGQAALFVWDQSGANGQGGDTGGRLTLAAAYAYTGSVTDHFGAGQGLAGEVARTRTLKRITGLRQHQVNLRTGGVVLMQPDALLVLPLVYEDQLQGVAELTFAQTPDERTENYLLQAANALAAHLHSARAQERIRHLLIEAQGRTEQLLAQEEEMRQNIDQLEATRDQMLQVQQALSSERANIQALIDSTPDNIVLIDRNYRIRAVNAQIMARYAQAGIEIQPGMHVHELLPEAIRAEWIAYYDQALAGEMLDFVKPRQDADGLKHISYAIHPIREGREITGCSIFSRDITLRIQAQQALQENQERLRQLNENLEQAVLDRTREMEASFAVLRTTLETTRDGILVTDNSDHKADINHRLAEIFHLPGQQTQYPLDALLVQIRQHLKHPEVLDDVVRRARTELPATTEDLLELIDGRWVQLYSQRPRGEAAASAVGRVWGFRDITEQRQGELAVRTSEQRMRLFFDHTHEGVVLHERGRILDANPAMLHMLGLTREEILGTHIFNYILPEDHQRVRTDSQAGSNTAVEIRILHRFGHQLTILTNDREIELENGQRGHLVFARDLTEQKQAEAQLLSIAQAVPLPLMVTRYEEPVVLYVNDQFTSVFGYAEPQVVGTRTRRFYAYPEVDIPQLSRALEANNGTVSGFKLDMLRTDGAIVNTVVNSDLIIFKGEKAILFGFQDITDLKRQEGALRESNEQLEAAFGELKSAQQQLALSEKLALMGQLTAGIAHEINTPLSAAHSSAQSLYEVVPSAFADVVALSRKLPKAETEQLYHLLAGIRDMGARPQLTTREERALRQQLTVQLRDAGMSDADLAARRLVESGFASLITPELISLLTGKHGEVVLDTVAQVGRMYTSMDNIRLASDKTRNIVRALKRYTHTTRQDDTETVNLAENLQTILILYAHQIRSHAELDAQIPEESSIVVRANGDKLGQVWTNLITNALQAMEVSPEVGSREDGVRISRLQIRLDLTTEGHAEVTVGDTGKGIPEDVLPRIFDPFFTTKAKGEGTGMGLQITKSIVEGYGGNIRVTSRPGLTEFVVTLPIASS